MPRAWLLAVPLFYFLYFFDLTGMGLVGPDEPRYAWIGREMARSGDWITPRLWGHPWFEKPALLYWMTGAAFRAGLGDDLAPRLPVAILSVVFLLFVFWILRREFGFRPALFATSVLATSAGWLGFSHIGVTDLPMAATFSAAMLLALPWVERRETKWLPAAAALLGVAVLAKGLVPLVLFLPLAWAGRRRLVDLLRPHLTGLFLLVAAPWYLLCTLRNGTVFLKQFFWVQHFERFATAVLRHEQPFWFYLPVLIAALFPWAPLLVLLFRKSLYSDARRRFLLQWLVFGFVFFSASENKLPGYLLPLLPAAAVLLGLALDEARDARWLLASSGVLLVSIPVAAHILPRALASGITRSGTPPFDWTWFIPLAAGAAVWFLERRSRREGAVVLLAVAVTAGVVFLTLRAFPAIDQAVSARPMWHEIASRSDQVCVEQVNRSWRYGLDYYSVTPLPDCSETPRRLQIVELPGKPPVLLQPGVDIHDGSK